MYSIPAVLKTVFGVGSLATLKGGYWLASRGKHTASTIANAVKEMHTDKGEGEQKKIPTLNRPTMGLTLNGPFRDVVCLGS